MKSLPTRKKRSMRDILEEGCAAKIPCKPPLFRSHKKQKLATIIRAKKFKIAHVLLHPPLHTVSAGSNFRNVVGDLIGSVRNDGLPVDLSSNKKKYLPELIRAKKSHSTKHPSGRVAR